VENTVHKAQLCAAIASRAASPESASRQLNIRRCQ
jgi:hypothetical protein